MAELNMPQKKGKRRLQTPRIDLTPMVDLGFLLITFFMFTTTLANPKLMEIKMPSNEKTNAPTVFISECTITLIPTKEHKVIYYSGELNDASQLKEVTSPKIIDILLKKKREVSVLPLSFSKDAHKLHVLIKPFNNCKYDDVVQMLDDMTIVDVQTYALTDISSEEEKMIKGKF